MCESVFDSDKFLGSTPDLSEVVCWCVIDEARDIPQPCRHADDVDCVLGNTAPTLHCISSHFQHVQHTLACTSIEPPHKAMPRTPCVLQYLVRHRELALESCRHHIAPHSFAPKVEHSAHCECQLHTHSHTYKHIHSHIYIYTNTYIHSCNWALPAWMIRRAT